MEQSYLKCCSVQGRGSPNLKVARPYSQLPLTAPLQHIEDVGGFWRQMCLRALVQAYRGSSVPEKYLCHAPALNFLGCDAG